MFGPRTQGWVSPLAVSLLQLLERSTGPLQAKNGQDSTAKAIMRNTGGCLGESGYLPTQGYNPDQLHCLLTYWMLGFSSVTLLPDYSML